MDCDKYQSYVWSQVYFKEAFVLEAVYVGTKHVCVSAGALGLLGEVSLNKLAVYLKMMMTGDSFSKSFLHCPEQTSREAFAVQMDYL